MFLDSVKTGWIVGFGAEYMLTPNWTVRGEYLYYDLEGTRVVGAPLNQPANGFGADGLYAIFGSIARVGVNYKFGWGWARHREVLIQFSRSGIVRGFFVPRNPHRCWRGQPDRPRRGYGYLARELQVRWTSRRSLLISAIFPSKLKPRIARGFFVGRSL
jgi:Outer membrane protein beta-barrel domain